MSWKTHGIVGAVLLVAVLLGVSALWQGPAAGAAPAVNFTYLDGRTVPLEGLRGKTVLVTFWASTCGECLREMPALKALHQDLAGPGFEIVGVAMSYDPPNRVLETSERMRIPYPVSLDIHGEIAAAFGDVSITPASFLISPAGRIVARHAGRLNFEELREEIRNLDSTVRRAEPG